MDISNCVSLHTLGISIPGPLYSDPYPFYCLGIMLDMIQTSQIPPREFRIQYNMQRWPAPLEQLADYKWQKIQSVLMALTPCPPRVTISFRYAYMRGTLGAVETQFIRNQLSRLDEQGLLSIE